MLDGVTDVRNFGAIARTCECAAVDAVIIPVRGSASVNADAVKHRQERYILFRYAVNRTSVRLCNI